MVDIYFLNRGDNPNGDYHVIGIERRGGLFHSSFYLLSWGDILILYCDRKRIVWTLVADRQTLYSSRRDRMGRKGCWWIFRLFTLNFSENC